MHNKFKLSFLITVLLIIVIVTVSCLLTKHTYTKTDYALNTIVKITIEAKTANQAKAMATLATDEVKRIENLLSCYKEESDVYRINNYAHTEPIKVSGETYELIKRCLYYNRLTDGAFDITVKPLVDLWNINSANPQVPRDADIKSALEGVGINNIILMEGNRVYIKNPRTKIDFGGVAKGYCANQIKQILENNGITNALIDLGGNIYAMGKNQNGDSWNIGIQKPFAQRGETIKSIKLSNQSAVTSGAYERCFENKGNIYHHILNPKTGYPAESDFKSVTVISTDSELCDALSTALFVAGMQKVEAICKKIDSIYVMAVNNNDKVTEFGNKSK